MADFQSSTHRARWIFTPQQLLNKHKVANQRAVQLLQQYGLTRMRVDVDGTISYPEPIIDQDDKAGRSIPKSLNCEEEQKICIYYEQKIQEVCAAFMFPHKIQATAILYFKRFYLQWSIMEHDPKSIMLTCIYASCKVEENHVSAEELGKGIHQDPDMILKNEIAVLQSLGFDLIVYSPYRSVDGFIEDMQAMLPVGNFEEENLKVLRATAYAEVDRIMLTDAPLLYPPGQLALSVLRKANEKHGVLDFERYLEIMLSRQRFAMLASELIESFGAIDSLVARFQIPTEKDNRHIDRKLRNCCNPSSHDENRKREKKSKHKSKRTAAEMQGASA